MARRTSALKLLVGLLVSWSIFGCGKTSTAPTRVIEATERNATQPAEAPESTEPPRNPIAKVLGTEIFEEDLNPPSSRLKRPGNVNEPQTTSERREALEGIILAALMDKYCRENGIEPTKEEIETYNETMGKFMEMDKLLAIGEEELPDKGFAMDKEDLLVLLRASLASGELDESQTHDVMEQIRLLEEEGPESVEERLIRYLRSKLESKDIGEEARQAYAEELAMLESIQSLPEFEMRMWNFDRALYAQYGGIVIFEQSNPRTPVGAYRQWLEEAERAGDFEILDPVARSAFWRYYTHNWASSNWVVRDPDPFDKPWWLKDPGQTNEPDRQERN